MPPTSIWKTITEDELNDPKRSKRGLPPMHPGKLLREEILPALARPKRKSPSCSACRVRRSMTSSTRRSRCSYHGIRLGKLCGNGSISGSICRSGTICTAPSNNWGQDQDHPTLETPDETPQAEVRSKAGRRLVDASKTSAVRIERETAASEKADGPFTKLATARLFGRDQITGVERRIRNSHLSTKTGGQSRFAVHGAIGMP